MHKTIKPGDIVCFEQKDGNQLTLIVYTDGIAIKAECPGTDIQIYRISRFAVKATAIERKME